MKRKIFLLILLGVFLVVSGICYSCNFKRDKEVEFLNSSIEDKEYKKDSQEKESGSTEQNPQVSTSVEEINDSGQNPETGNDKVLVVHICGAVENPGVYVLDSGARIVDLIRLAGGLSKEADGDYINQAQTISDGQRIYIPTQQEVEEGRVDNFISGETVEAVKASEDIKLVNINTAQAEELMTLPGIGQAKARSILEYRDTNGAFKTIDDLMKIPGIKEGLFRQVSSLITVK